VVIIRHIYTYRHGINLFNCENVSIRDFTIHALPGMGVFGTRTQNITLKNYQVRPSGNRIMSGNVDATHFVSCTGTIEIDSSYFQGMGDDATNVHSFYYTVGERLDQQTIRAYICHSFSHGEKMNDYPDVGDQVEFVRKETLYGYATAKIIAADFDATTKETIIKFDKPLPDDFEKTDLVANLSKHARLKFTNNVVRDIRGRGILVQTRDAIIENNSFEYCTGQGVHVNTAYPWMESIGTRDVVIRNNRFLACGFGVTDYCDAIAVVVETEAEKPFVGIHKNLIIEDNYVIGGFKPAFYLSCLDGALIRRNRVISNSIPVREEFTKNIKYENNSFNEQDVVVGVGCE